MPSQKGEKDMLKWYKVIYRTLWRGRTMHEANGIVLDEEENVLEKSIKDVSWSAIEKEEDTFLDRGFDVFRCRKGLKIEFWDHISPVLKQWEGETELQIETIFMPTDVSLERAMAYGDGIKVLKWMVESTDRFQGESMLRSIIKEGKP